VLRQYILTLVRVHRYLENVEVWCWKRMEKIIWNDCVRNQEVLHSQGGEEYPIYNEKDAG